MTCKSCEKVREFLAKLTGVTYKGNYPVETEYRVVDTIENPDGTFDIITDKNLILRGVYPLSTDDPTMKPYDPDNPPTITIDYDQPTGETK